MTSGATSEQLVEAERLSEETQRFAAAPSLDGRGFHEKVENFKRWLIEDALRRTGGNRTEAAKLLGVQRTYFMKLIRDLGISMPFPRRRARRAKLEKPLDPLQPTVTELPEPAATELPPFEPPPQDLLTLPH